jgi:hypothetical protein
MTLSVRIVYSPIVFSHMSRIRQHDKPSQCGYRTRFIFSATQRMQSILTTRRLSLFCHRRLQIFTNILILAYSDFWLHAVWSFYGSCCVVVRWSVVLAILPCTSLLHLQYLMSQQTCALVERIVTGTVVYFELWSILCTKIIYSYFCVHLTLYIICTSCRPIEQLITEHMIGMATTAHQKPVLC